MADSYPLMFTGEDRAAFQEWLETCKRRGTARTMAGAIRLAVQVAAQADREDVAIAAGDLAARKGGTT